jgi:peroxiredoxin
MPDELREIPDPAEDAGTPITPPHPRGGLGQRQKAWLGMVILGIDVRDEFTRVKPFADRMQVNYPLLDANNRQDVEDAFAPMWGLPTTVIVGPDGKVAKRHSGIATKEQLKEYVESLL